MMPFSNIKKTIKRIPIISAVSRAAYYYLIEPFRSFPGSREYWKSRYAQGGTSGDGSYDELALFKAEILNALVDRNRVNSVIEFGCGDGNQLVLANYPRYLGLDISPDAIAICKQHFGNDDNKTFLSMSEYSRQQAEMSLSLDVIYHLVEDMVFHDYMKLLFSAATRFVVIYSSNTDTQQSIQGKHIRHRQFTSWVEKHAGEWELSQHIPNRHPYNSANDTGSFADFYIYQRASA